MHILLLVVVSLAAGIGISAVGPGGVLATIGLYALTALSPAQIAGTAIVTHVATGAVGTAAYTRSGQLRDPATRRTAYLLAGVAVLGAPLGVLLNTTLSGRVFGLLLGVFAVLVAALVWHRDRESSRARTTPTPLTLAVIGFGVAVVSGLLGLGGPMLAVPLLVAVGQPILSALAAAQAQSIVVASVGAVGYLVQGDVDWPLVALVGFPELAGVVVGWLIARALPTRTLKYGLIGVLLAVAPYLAWHG
ncbi:MAG TPA: sulfite exporter TauE/SafE family protein [Pseudonocardiaceae bacterium]|nr:sulfite exporter TauE/SafE family protein [Pseudonocardiaceae bacterium]